MSVLKSDTNLHFYKSLHDCEYELLTDLTIVCSDGRVETFQAFFAWISSSLRRFFQKRLVSVDDEAMDLLETCFKILGVDIVSYHVLERRRQDSVRTSLPAINHKPGEDHGAGLQGPDQDGAGGSEEV